MKLQSALDFHDLNAAVHFFEKIHTYVDIVEMGTPLLLKEGCKAIECFRELYPEKTLLADTKIVDGGKGIASDAFSAGADIVTVLGMTNDSTIGAVVEAAANYGRKVCVDTIGVTDLVNRVRKLEEFGVDIIAVHTAHDMLHCASVPVEALRQIKRGLLRNTCQTAISGGIKPQDLPEICTLAPDIVIVGSGLTKAADPVGEIKNYRNAMMNAK